MTVVDIVKKVKRQQAPGANFNLSIFPWCQIFLAKLFGNGYCSPSFDHALNKPLLYLMNIWHLKNNFRFFPMGKDQMKICVHRPVYNHETVSLG